MDPTPVPFRAHGPTQGRFEETRVPQAPAHGMRPAACVGDGRAAARVESRTGRGTVENRVPERSGDARRPRAPLPVNPHQTTEGIRPQAVPAERQTAPHPCQGQEVGEAAHPGARAHRREAQTCGLASRVRPFRVGHGRRHGTVETLRRHAGGTQKPRTVRPVRQRQERGRDRRGGMRHLQGRPAHGAHRPRLGQRHRIRPACARGRIVRHARLLRRPLLLMPTGRQRERERRDTPLPAQENHFRGAHRRRITGHRPGDQ